MIYRGEKFFISKANRVDLIMEEPDMLLDNRSYYFVYDFMEDSGYGTESFVDYEYDLDNSRVCMYVLTDEYLNIYTDDYTDLGLAHIIPAEKSRVVLPKNIDYEKYNLTRLKDDEALFVDKVVYNYKTRYIECYLQVFSDYEGKVETVKASKEDFQNYLKSRNFTEN